MVNFPDVSDTFFLVNNIKSSKRYSILNLQTAIRSKKSFDNDFIFNSGSSDH